MLSSMLAEASGAPAGGRITPSADQSSAGDGRSNALRGSGWKPELLTHERRGQIRFPTRPEEIEPLPVGGHIADHASPTDAGAGLVQRPLEVGLKRCRRNGSLLKCGREPLRDPGPARPAGAGPAAQAASPVVIMASAAILAVSTCMRRIRVVRES
jgi:hypothetical protein